MARVILNPYRIAYALGLRAQGLAPANPRPLSFEQYLPSASSLRHLLASFMRDLHQFLPVSGMSVDCQDISDAWRVELVPMNDTINPQIFSVLGSICTLAQQLKFRPKISL
jgi:hypothetical protein